MGREGLLLPTPDGVVVVGGDVQTLGRLSVVHVLVQAAAGKVVEDPGVGNQLPKQAGLEVQETTEGFGGRGYGW